MKVVGDFYLVAAIALHHLRQEDSSVVVLIFARLREEPPEMVYTLKPRIFYIFPYLVNLRSWLGESNGDFNPVNLESALKCLPKLPIIRANHSVTPEEIRNAILEDAPKQDSSSRFSMPTSDGVRIAVSLNWTTFLEEDILNFEAEITEEKPGGLEEAHNTSSWLQKKIPHHRGREE
ncbi:hypothetical protein E0Z10_g6075 [Xylaria hypoxylon]|uniref:Uncharacterized protein n=1 Tax=Xylaria hypoxylon TaxID=37992 RepID=A0A4Z0YU60_9PEZI|nr:hypothetical protein E0Z10_g6075 [Xylaria hypoxylon]